MPLPRENIYTIDDIYNLPEGQRAELVDGDLYMMAPPSRIHQQILSWLHGNIFNHIKAHGGDCEVYPAPFAVFLNDNDAKYLEPDISVICDKDKLDDKGCHGAPDWVVEIVSPSSRRMDYFIKLFKYRTAGVREYWIVDPSKKNITVYFFEGDIWAEHYTFIDKVKVNIYDDLCLNFAELNL